MNRSPGVASAIGLFAILSGCANQTEARGLETTIPVVAQSTTPDVTTPEQNPNTIVEVPFMPIEIAGCRTTSTGHQYLINLQIVFGAIAMQKDLPRVIPRVIENSSNLAEINTNVDRAIDSALHTAYEERPTLSDDANARAFGDALKANLQATVMPRFARGLPTGKKKIAVIYGDVGGEVQQGCDVSPTRIPARPSTIAANTYAPLVRRG